MSEESFELHITLQRVRPWKQGVLARVLGSDWHVGDLVLMDGSFDDDGKGEVKTLCNAKAGSLIEAAGMMSFMYERLTQAGFMILRAKIEEICADTKLGWNPILGKTVTEGDSHEHCV